MDRPTGSAIRRYERERPGELVHVDVKKLDRIPDGGSHNALGRQAGLSAAWASTASTPRSTITPASPTRKIHAVFMTRAAPFFAGLAITGIERVLTYNAWAYRKGLAWKQALVDIGATGKLTRP